MIKQMLKAAGVRSEKELLKKYPNEIDFLRDHGHKLFEYQEGGVPPQEMMQQGAPPMEQQGAAPEQGGGGEEQAMQQIIQFIVQALQQQMPQDQIIAQLVKMTGMPQEQAMQILQMVVEKMSAGGGEQGAPQQQEAPLQEMAEAPQAQGPQEEMAEQGPPPQEGMRMGGTPCYKCGGRYKNGGSYSGTYSAGVYYANGGSYMPDYSQYAYGGYYPTYQGGGEPCPDPNMVKDAEGHCICKEGYEADQMTGQCFPIGQGEEDQGSGPAPSGAPSIGSQSNIPRGGFNAGFGLQGKRYNFDYGFGVGADMKSNVRHNVDLNFPGLFRMGANKGDLGIRGTYSPGRQWSGDVVAGFPISGKKGRADLLRFTGGMGQHFNDPELDLAMNPANDDYMRINQKKNPVSYNAGLEYIGKMFGEKGPDVKIRASYDRQKYGGTPKYKKGGEYEMTDDEIQDLINKGYKIQYL